MNSWKLPIAAAALALAGCGNSSPPPPADTGSPPADAAATPDAGSSTDAGPQACVYPPGPYGSDEGRTFRPFTLPNCEADEDYDFGGQDFCSNAVTVVVASAGWCVPCQHEAPQIQQLITEAYAGRGVRVVGVMMQNPNYGPPTKAFCQQWRRDYGMTNPFVIDPQGLTQIYFPNMAYPANIIIDNRGRIRYRQYGSSEGLSTLIEQIDTILAEQGR